MMVPGHDPEDDIKGQGLGRLPESRTIGEVLLATRVRPAESDRIDPGGSGPDDPRVAAALEEYLEALGRNGLPSRDEFLGRYPEIAGELAGYLSGLEFIQAAGGWLKGEGGEVEESGEEAWGLPGRNRLGDYTIVREIGRGGMGVVYEALQVSLGRKVALKVLPLHSAIDSRRRQRFLIEAQAAAQLHHPHIVPVFGAGCDGGIHFFAMQYVEGLSLAEVIRRRRHALAVTGPLGVDRAGAGPQDRSAEGAGPGTGESPVSEMESAECRERAYWNEVARLGIQAARALEHAHALGVIHRDVKPANLLVDGDGELWITDFGLARFGAETSLTHSGDLVGTLRYMSPEQSLARRGVVDQRTDVYALGATLYELLTLRPALEGSDHQELLRQIALEEPIPPRRHDRTIPRDLETIVLKAMAKDLPARYGTARELAEDLERFRDDRPILARRPSPRERLVRWVRRHPGIVATAALIGMITVATSTVFQIQRNRAVARARLEYIQQTFPIVDAITMTAMGQATMMAGEGRGGMGDPAMSGDIYEHALAWYEWVAKLPQVDLESRRMVAWANNRMGFTRAVIARSLGNDPTMLRGAEADYRRSIEMFERLRVEVPRDRAICQYLINSLGGWGLGWFLGQTRGLEAAEPSFRRAVDLGHELALAHAGPGAGVDPRALLEDLGTLTQATDQLAGKLEAAGRGPEAGELRRRRAGTVDAIASHAIGLEARQAVGQALAQLGQHGLDRGDRSWASFLFRLAGTLAPENPTMGNNLAWSLACSPACTPEEARLAIEAARRAIAAAPGNFAFWNTLGAAAYRAGDWRAAAEALEKSMALHQGGDAFDWLLMAMTCRRRGDPAEARRWFDRAAEPARAGGPSDPELDRLRAEAADLLGVTGKAAKAHADVPGPGH